MGLFTNLLVRARRTYLSYCTKKKKRVILASKLLSSMAFRAPKLIVRQNTELQNQLWCGLTSSSTLTPDP